MLNSQSDVTEILGHCDWVISLLSCTYILFTTEQPLEFVIEIGMVNLPSNDGDSASFSSLAIILNAPLWSIEKYCFIEVSWILYWKTSLAPELKGLIWMNNIKKNIKLIS